MNIFSIDTVDKIGGMRFINQTIVAIVISLQFISCEQSDVVESEYSQGYNGLTRVDSVIEFLPKEDTILAEELEISTLEKKFIDSGLVDIQNVDSSIQIDLKYTTTNNFVGIDLYGKLQKVYLQPEIASRLKVVQESLRTIDSSLSLLIYDGTRPRSVQQKMWEALDSIPVNQRVKFVSNPRNGSIHNYGCAVDLTIVNIKTGDILDMGAGFDDPRRIAYPKFEKEFLKSGELTQEQVNNRYLLRKVMRKGGFWVLPTEWWHFNGYSRDKAKEKFFPIE
jgi:D-alanyl-D-alanine dipeptidase